VTGASAKEREIRLAALDASIARGVADAEVGRVKSASKVFDDLEAKLRAKTKHLDRHRPCNNNES
jgi:antitoxin ParD1/3/4